VRCPAIWSERPELSSIWAGDADAPPAHSYLGLYQHSPSTWRGNWNPWRDRSIYDGVAQIWATATAIHRGYGPDMWPNTYPAAF